MEAAAVPSDPQNQDPLPTLPVLRIRYPVPFSPGSGMGKKSRSGSRIRIRDERPASYFRELQFFDAHADPDPGIFLRLDPGSGVEKIPIRESF